MWITRIVGEICQRRGMHRCFLNSLSGVQKGEEAGLASIYRDPGECLAWTVRIQPTCGGANLAPGHLPVRPSCLAACCLQGPWPGCRPGGKEVRGVPRAGGGCDGGSARYPSRPAGHRRCLTVTFFQGPLL